MSYAIYLSLFNVACLAAGIALTLHSRRKAHQRGIDRQAQIAHRLLTCALPLERQFPAAAAALRVAAHHLARGLPFDGISIRRELLFVEPAPALIDLEDLPQRLQTPTSERDVDGYCSHPALPALPEGTDVSLFLLSFGFRTALVAMDSDCSDEELVDSVFKEGTSCIAWQPTPPAGDNWNLLEIFDSEDGPHALFARPMTTAELKEHTKLMQYREDSIRNYQQAIATALQEHQAIAAFAADKTARPPRSANRLTRLATKHIAELHAECDLLRQERDDARAALPANAY